MDASTHSDLLVPRVLQPAGDSPVVCFINTSDRHVSIEKGETVARAVEIEGVTDPVPTQKTGQGGVDPGWGKSSQIPAHLMDLFERSKGLLTEGEQGELASLLGEYGDVFAASEFDLGNFTAVEHQIDTGGHKPIKQRMRRTPVGFEREEKAHLEKMLEAGVIQPSVSEWCSCPVLVRKRDGGPLVY